MFDKLIEDLQKILHRTKNTSRKGGKKFYDEIRIPVDTRIIYERMRGNDVVETVEFKNIVTQRASILVQKLLAGYKDTQGVTYFALGVGDPFGNNWVPENLNNGEKWDCYDPPDAPTSGGRKYLDTGVPILIGEIARKKIDTRQFLVSAETGVVSEEPTHICAYKALFLETEGNGPLMEFALFGGTVQPDIDYIPAFQTNDDGVLLKDSNGIYIPYTGIDRLVAPGDMITYKTHKLFFKTSGDRLRVTYIIEMKLNQAEPEPAAD